MAVFGEAAGSCGVAVRLVVGLAAGVALGAATGASAAPAAMEPVAAGVGGAEEGLCARPLAEVVWGFVLVLLALTVSLWGTSKYRFNGVEKLFILLLGVFGPLQDLQLVIGKSWGCVVMVWKCHKLEDPQMRLMSVKWVRLLFSLLNPWSRLPARILTSCVIVLYLPKGAPEESNEMSSEQSEGLEKAKEAHEDLESPPKSKEVSCVRSELLDESWEWLWKRIDVIDESEAMVVGEDGARKCRNEYYVKKQLSMDGKLALLWEAYFLKGDKCKFLPDYDELKFLRGNSGFATIAIAIQAVGYIYGVLFRSIKGLRVAPIEVIGLILNIMLLVKASHYSTSNPCHRPLIIYMNEEREGQFLSGLKSKPISSFRFDKLITRIICISNVLIICVCLYIPLVYFIVTYKRDVKIMIVLPLIFFTIGTFGDIFYCVWNLSSKYYQIYYIYILYLGILSNAIAYLWAMQVTLRYWKLEHFNSRPELVDLAQIIPFIG